jgi:hypothetical protein
MNTAVDEPKPPARRAHVNVVLLLELASGAAIWTAIGYVLARFL